MGRDGHHQPRLQADDRLRGWTGCQGVLALVGLGRPLAARRATRGCARSWTPSSARASPRMPDLHPHPYEHRPPRRPSRLARRTTPPPEHPEPPNLRYLGYVGLLLTAVVVALAVPYIVSYLVQLVGG